MPELLESVELPDPLLPVEPAPPVLEDEPLLLCFFLLLLLDFPLPSVEPEPDPPVLDAPEPIESDVPLLDPVPLVPPLVDPPDCANAAPAASIETTANRFHQLFRMNERSR